ncbi:MAG: hypothetical protein JNL02_20090 [Saprospiraceae bacterium]|nr:hypothetical protein [Saprospiraceae bacterium]
MRIIWLSLLFLLSLNACDKSTPLPEAAQVSLVFENVVNGQPLTYSAKQYTNAAGDSYSVELLKYYVTNVVLLRADGAEFKLGNYDLIDAAKPATCEITAGQVPNGHYTGMRFLLGVDSLRNHTGLQDGDLDPVYGMLWNWNTGYIFFKHEGRFTNAQGEDQGLIFHFGSDIALTPVEISFPEGLHVEGVARKAFIRFDLAPLYATPHVIDFNLDNYRQSITADDRIWLANMKENMPGAFSFSRVE